MPKPAPFLALLRGINVGGKNVIPMQDLRACFQDLGFVDVETYIQTGNVLFRAEQTQVKELTSILEAGLSKTFAYSARVALLSRRKYASAISAAPPRWGHDEQQKHNAMFTLASTTPKRVLSLLPAPKPDIETVSIGPGVIFWSVSKTDQNKTTMAKLARETAYQQLTIRNHNTVFKLQQMLNQH